MGRRDREEGALRDLCRGLLRRLEEQQDGTAGHHPHATGETDLLRRLEDHHVGTAGPHDVAGRSEDGTIASRYRHCQNEAEDIVEGIRVVYVRLGIL